MRRRSFTGCLLLPLLAPVTALARSKNSQPVDAWPDAYDRYFQEYTKRYFGPYFDWRWFKAQAVAESNLDPDAESEDGAIGLMQILPTTYKDVVNANPQFANLTDPRWNIAAGIFYNRSLYRKWRKPPPGEERLLFAFGSYNAGYYRVLSAAKRARQPIERWTEVAPFVPGETRIYVMKIKKLMA